MEVYEGDYEPVSTDEFYIGGGGVNMLEEENGCEERECVEEEQKEGDDGNFRLVETEVGSGVEELGGSDRGDSKLKEKTVEDLAEYKINDELAEGVPSLWLLLGLVLLLAVLSCGI